MNVWVESERRQYIFLAPCNIITVHLWLMQPGKHQISPLQVTSNLFACMWVSKRLLIQKKPSRMTYTYKNKWICITLRALEQPLKWALGPASKVRSLDSRERISYYKGYYWLSIFWSGTVLSTLPNWMYLNPHSSFPNVETKVQRVCITDLRFHSW